jgi:hypothetical protein
VGLLDKLKGAIHAVTGGAAKVSIDYPPGPVAPGGRIAVKVTAASAGGEVKSGGIFVDLLAVERVSLRNVRPTRVHETRLGIGAALQTGTQQAVSPPTVDVDAARNTFEQSYPIAPAFVLAAGEARTFEGAVELPPNVLPSFSGGFAAHEWKIRGRVEAWGNDPDSGWLPLRVG